MISEVPFVEDDISNLLNNLKLNKAHGWDDISISMIKLCGNSIVKPLYIIYKNCISKGIFPDTWKKTNVVPTHKKENNLLVTIVQYHFYLCLGKCSRDSYSYLCILT